MTDGDSGSGSASRSSSGSDNVSGCQMNGNGNENVEDPFGSSQPEWMNEANACSSAVASDEQAHANIANDDVFSSSAGDDGMPLSDDLTWEQVVASTNTAAVGNPFIDTGAPNTNIPPSHTQQHHGNDDDDGDDDEPADPLCRPVSSLLPDSDAYIHALEKRMERLKRQDMKPKSTNVSRGADNGLTSAWGMMNMGANVDMEMGVTDESGLHHPATAAAACDEHIDGAEASRDGRRHDGVALQTELNECIALLSCHDQYSTVDGNDAAHVGVSQSSEVATTSGDTDLTPKHALNHQSGPNNPSPSAPFVPAVGVATTASASSPSSSSSSSTLSTSQSQPPTSSPLSSSCSILEPSDGDLTAARRHRLGGETGSGLMPQRQLYYRAQTSIARVGGSLEEWDREDGCTIT